MNHCTTELIQAYILDSLTEIERTEFEDHAFACDHCLVEYVNCIEAEGYPLPILSNEEQFTEQIMSKIAKRDNTSTTASTTAWVRRKSRLLPLVHYGIAASITLLLMTSGVFQGITRLASTIEEAPKQEEPSISHNVMNKALQWINLDELNHGEGKQ